MQPFGLYRNVSGKHYGKVRRAASDLLYKLKNKLVQSTIYNPISFSIYIADVLIIHIVHVPVLTFMFLFLFFIAV